MPVTPPFSPFVPHSQGLPEHLIPNPPADIPEAPDVPDAMASAPESPEELRIQDIIKNLTLERQLPLFIPNRERYPEKSFHIINNLPQEMAEAMRFHWQPTTIPEYQSLFDGKVSGVDKTGKITTPILMERDARITGAYAKLKRQKLKDQYEALDPRNKGFNSKYVDTEVAINAGTTKGSFSGAGWRIKV